MIEIPSRMNERRAIHLPLRGPFVVLGQNDKVPDMPWTDFLFANAAKSTEVFDLKWGNVYYQNNGENKIEVAGYYYDVSG